MEDNPLGELCKGIVDISKCNIQNCEYAFCHRLTSGRLPVSFSQHVTGNLPVCSPFPVKNGKNMKPHVLSLQDKEQGNLQFDLAADSLEELYEWYKVAWDITQREKSKQYNREQEVSV